MPRAVQVLSFSLHATSDATTAWLRPQESSSSGQAAAHGGLDLGRPAEGSSDVGLGLGGGGVGSGGGLGGGLGTFGYPSEPPSVDCCIAGACAGFGLSLLVPVTARGLLAREWRYACKGMGICVQTVEVTAGWYMPLALGCKVSIRCPLSYHAGRSSRSRPALQPPRSVQCYACPGPPIMQR